jgi:hypothetical protein
VASAILVELNIRLTVLVVETARLERRGVNDTRFGPSTPTPRVRGAQNRVWSASTASTVRLGKIFITQKLYGRSVLVGADHTFGPVIRIWKDLGPM